MSTGLLLAALTCPAWRATDQSRCLWTVTKNQHQSNRPVNVPLKSELMRPLGKEQTAQGCGCLASRVLFLTRLNILLIKSQVMILGELTLRDASKLQILVHWRRTFLPLHAWRRGTEAPVTSFASLTSRVTLWAASGVSETHPDLSIYPMFAAWDHEKLLSTLKIIFSKVHRSFFK